MRWSEYLAACDPADAETLTNALTLGFGTLASAARQIGRNGEGRAIVAELGLAELALDQAYGLLPGTPARVVRPLPHALPAGLSWQAYLTRRRWSDHRLFVGWMQELVSEARQAGTLTQTDGTVAELADRVGTVLDRLERLRLELAAGI